MFDNEQIEELFPGENKIFFSAFKEPGESVIIDSVEIKNGGYVVIHESIYREEDVIREPGDIIGSSALLLPGESQDILVELERTTKDGEEFIAMLHHDNGDGIFVAADDVPIKDENGDIVLMPFLIAEDSALLFDEDADL